MGERGRFTAFVLRRANLELARRVGIAIVLAAGSTACGGADDDVLGPGAAGAGGATEGIAGQSSWIGQSGAGGAGGAADAGVPPPPDAGAAGAPSVDECPRVRVVVAAGATLNVRPEPSTAQAPVGTLANGSIVDKIADVQGESVNGSTLWYQISSPNVSGYVSSTYAECTTDQAPVLTPPTGYYLPLQCGKSAKISQGNFGSFSHAGKSAYAFDFSLGVGTPMVAMADGVVLHVYDKTKPGDPCYDGGGSSCYPYANLVVLLHGDGTASIYKHLSKVLVSLNDFVPRGTPIGLSGSTGYSTGPHAHVMREENCGVANCQSIPLSFADVSGNGVPTTGQTVTSGNCP